MQAKSCILFCTQQISDKRGLFFMVDNKIIGSRIEQLRKKRKETQTDLAGVLNVKRQVISYYETGARTPNVDDLIILAEHYNTTVDYLLGRTEIETVSVDIQMICDYTGLSETAVNRLHLCGNNPIYPLKLNVLSELISPSMHARHCFSLPNIALLLNEFEHKYKTLIEKMNIIYESLDSLPIEKIMEISKDFATKTNLAKIPYYEAVEGIKTLIDSYVESHIKTEKNISVEVDFWVAINNREEEYLNGKYN
jgi:transcriptional regulator with XRE-family HTH domain